MLDRHVHQASGAVKPFWHFTNKLTVDRVWLAIQPIFVDGSRNETANVGMKPPGSWQEDPKVVRHRGLPLE
jgi:hypothetical protein